MKILFINFNIGSTAGLNNGVASLSAVLKKNGHETGLVFICEELGYEFDLARIKQDVLKFGPDIIGISIMEPQYKYMASFCEDLRNYYKGFVICGGPYPTMDPDTVLLTKGVDAVCVGEGEGAMARLAEAVKKGSDWTHIDNIWLKSPDGKIIKNKLRPFIDLDSLPPEDKELFDLDAIIRIKNYQLETMLGRGCAYSCAYCINQSYFDMYKKLCAKPVNARDYVRIRDVASVVADLKGTVSRHPQIKKIAFIDDNFLMYDGFLKDFYKKYKEEIRLPFMCNANPMSFSLSKARMLRDAGCDDIRFGVESGSERVKYDIMKRPIKNKSVIDAFKITRETGLMTSSFNMIGLPTENKEEIFETFKLNASILPDTIKVMTFYPFKNTPLYDLCEKMSLIDHDKKRQLDNYDTFTCLKFPDEYRLLLKKMQAAFNWYINMFLANEASSEYKVLVADIESMPEKQWDLFDFHEADKALSDKWRKKGVMHYSKFINRSLAVKFPSKHLG